MFEMIIKCALIALCGFGIGLSTAYLYSSRKKVVEAKKNEREVARLANEIYEQMFLRTEKAE